MDNSRESSVPVRKNPPGSTPWAFVTDPDKVGRCFPEVVDVTVQDPTHFEATVRVGVGGAANSR
jgi:carbon monoxide dehydrogenase subunit G